jgi:glycerol-1-phosphate dehydrogenase [NAD(P)+]
MKQICHLPAIQFTPFSEIDEKRPILLVTSTPAWNAVKTHLKLTIDYQPEPIKATAHHWDALITPQPAYSEVVYAVGGGLVADAGKYMAYRLGLPLVVLPTALSVDAFFTAAAGIREDGSVKYIEARPPDQVVIDLEIIAASPRQLRAAGITDVLSILTGSWDWQFAHQRGMNPAGMEFIPWVYENAQSILHGALDCAEAAGRGDHAGLKQLLDCLCMEVQLCNQVGHSRPEEGSEHYFAYCAEQFTGPAWPHADLLGPGILNMARLQGQESDAVEAAMKACHIPLDRIPVEVVERTIRELPEYCQKHNLPFGIAHTLSNKSG